MAHTTDYRGLIRQFSIVLFVVLGLYLVLVRPLAKQGVNILQGQIDETLIRLKKYLPEPETERDFLPTEKSVRAMQASLARGEENEQSLKRFIEPAQDYLPRDTQEAGLYFIEQLHIVTKRLRRQASTLGVKIPESFGFSEEMPQDSQNVQTLLEKLDIVDRVTSLLIEQGAEEIFLMKPLNPIERIEPHSKELFYRELPIQLSFLCNSSTLVRFLYQIKNFSPVLVVRDVIIKKQQGVSLRVEMLLSRLAV